MTKPSLAEIKASFRQIKNFPTPGVIFRDLTSWLQQPRIFRASINMLADIIRQQTPTCTKLVAVESRGFLIASPLAYILKIPLTLIRRPNKLPLATKVTKYETEYNDINYREVQTDDLNSCDQVVIVDDLIALGGTAWGCIQAVEACHAKVLMVLTLSNLTYLAKKPELEPYKITALVNHKT